MSYKESFNFILTSYLHIHNILTLSLRYSQVIYLDLCLAANLTVYQATNEASKL